MLKLLALLAFLLLGADAGYPNESYIEDIDVYDYESLLDLFSDHNGNADLEAENEEVQWNYDDYGFVDEPLEPDASSECDPLRLCQNEIEDFKENSTILGVTKEANVLDSICGDLGQLTSCIAQNEASCQAEDVKIETRVVKGIFEYTCSPAGRQLVMSLADSDCINKPQVEERFNNALQACMDTFPDDVMGGYFDVFFSGSKPQMSEFCPLVDQLKTCFMNESRDLCGSQMSEFVSNIWDITADSCNTTYLSYYIDEKVISLATKTSRFIGHF